MILLKSLDWRVLLGLFLTLSPAMATRPNLLINEEEDILASSLSSTTASLDLQNRPLTVDAINRLASTLSLSPSLTTLNLANTELNDEKAAILSENLNLMKELKKLDISRNAISDEGFIPLVMALGMHPSFAYLDVSQNQISDIGLNTLVFTLSDARALCHTILTDNKELTAEGAKALAEGFSSKSGLAVIMDEALMTPEINTHAARWYYNRGRMLLTGQGEISPSDNEAWLWLKKAAEKGHNEARISLAELYEKGRGVEQSDSEAFNLYQEASRHHYPQALFKVGQFYETGRSGKLSDSLAFSFYLQAAQQNHAEASYKVGIFYETGRSGEPFTTPAQWLVAFKKAQSFYHTALKGGYLLAGETFHTLEDKITTFEKAGLYFVKKLQGGVEQESLKDVTLLKHPLFKDISTVAESFTKFQPGIRETGIYLSQQLLTLDPLIAKDIVTRLQTLISTPTFQKSASSFDEGVSYAEDCLTEVQENLIRMTQVSSASSINLEEVPPLEYIPSISPDDNNESLSLPSSPYLKDFENSYFFKKILENERNQEKDFRQPTENRMAFSPLHPLFMPISSFAGALASYDAEVQEAGIYLTEQLLRFSSKSKQALVIANALNKLVRSEEFILDAQQEDKDAENQAKELLDKIGTAIKETLTLKELMTPQEVPPLDKLKINEDMVADPRIALYNYFFEEDNLPFDRAIFDSGVEGLLALFDKGVQEGKITKEMCFDNERAVYGNHQTLFDLLTNKEAYGGLTNRFSNRIIKIAALLASNKLDKETIYTQLASWSAAGHYCKTRSEGETYSFYIRNLAETPHNEREDDTLEVRVALSLAALRKQMMANIVPIDEKERLHQLLYLERKAFEELGLSGDIQLFEDPYEKNVVKDIYKRLPAKRIRSIILEGDDRAIPKGEGYENPEVLIKYITTTLNNLGNKSGIFPKLQERFEKQYGKKAIDRMKDYYNEDGEITEEGTKTLLYSLGYLEASLLSKQESKNNPKNNL